MNLSKRNRISNVCRFLRCTIFVYKQIKTESQQQYYHWLNRAVKINFDVFFLLFVFLTLFCCFSVLALNLVWHIPRADSMSIAWSFSFSLTFANIIGIHTYKIIWFDRHTFNLPNKHHKSSEIWAKFAFIFFPSFVRWWVNSNAYNVILFYLSSFQSLSHSIAPTLTAILIRFIINLRFSFYNINRCTYIIII